jgi:hypothetical protein
MKTYEYKASDKILQDSTIEEVERYNTIAEYFAKKSNRDRFYGTNVKYLEEMHDRLLILKGETMPEHISNLCSKLLKRFDAGII